MAFPVAHGSNFFGLWKFSYYWTIGNTFLIGVTPTSAFCLLTTVTVNIVESERIQGQRFDPNILHMSVWYFLNGCLFYHRIPAMKFLKLTSWLFTKCDQISQHRAEVEEHRLVKKEKSPAAVWAVLAGVCVRGQFLLSWTINFAKQPLSLFCYTGKVNNVSSGGLLREQYVIFS